MTSHSEDALLVPRAELADFADVIGNLIGECSDPGSGALAAHYRIKAMLSSGQYLSASPSLHVGDEERAGEACQRCTAHNPAWSAPSPLWNAVMRGGSIDGDPLFGDLVCATCFTIIAEGAGVASDWRLTAATVNVELEVTTPTGRVWNAEENLWDDPRHEGVGARARRELPRARDSAAEAAAGQAASEEAARACEQTPVTQPTPSLSAQDANNERMREAPEPFAERVDREMVDDLDRRRVSTLAKCGLLLMPKRGKGTELYAEILMALGVEDADCSDLIALEEARDHPEGHTLADRFAALSPTSEKDIRNDG